MTLGGSSRGLAKGAAPGAGEPLRHPRRPGALAARRRRARRSHRRGRQRRGRVDEALGRPARPRDGAPAGARREPGADARGPRCGSRPSPRPTDRAHEERGVATAVRCLGFGVLRRRARERSHSVGQRGGAADARGTSSLVVAAERRLGGDPRGGSGPARVGCASALPYVLRPLPYPAAAYSELQYAAAILPNRGGPAVWLSPWDSHGAGALAHGHSH